MQVWYLICSYVLGGGDLCILYIALIARKLFKLDDGRHRPKHVVLYCYKTQPFSHIFIVVFLTEFTSPYSLHCLLGEFIHDKLSKIKIDHVEDTMLYVGK